MFSMIRSFMYHRLFTGCLLCLLFCSQTVPGISMPGISMRDISMPDVAFADTTMLDEYQFDSLHGEPVEYLLKWQAREFSPEKLQQLEEDNALVYPVAAAEEGWWARFKQWFFAKLYDLLGNSARSGLLDILFYLFCLGAGIFIILRLLDIDLSSLVQRRAVVAPINVGEGIAENIHAMDFDKELALARQQRDYQRAIRLLYLASLKRLADAGLVRWEAGKTNGQYQRELKAAALKEHFASLGHYFEYAWYGEFPVNELLYEQAAAEYQQFRKQLEMVR